MAKSLKILSEMKDKRVDEWIAKQNAEDEEDLVNKYLQDSKKGASSNGIGTKETNKEVSLKKVRSKEDTNNSSLLSSLEPSRPNGAKAKVIKGLKNGKKGQAKRKESRDSSSDSAPALSEKQTKKISKKPLIAEPVEDQAVASGFKIENPTSTPVTSWWKKIFNVISNKDTKDYSEYLEVNKYSLSSLFSISTILKEHINNLF